MSIFKLTPIAALLLTVACTDDGGSTQTVIVFGNDSSEWANDGECDDKRFVGPAMTATTLLDSDIGRDASDCKAGFDAGLLAYVG